MAAKKAKKSGSHTSAKRMYCVSCKAKHEIKHPKYVVKNGRAMLRATCPKCGSKMNSFTKKR